jgi:hypothetical protein
MPQVQWDGVVWSSCGLPRLACCRSLPFAALSPAMDVVASLLVAWSSSLLSCTKRSGATGS